MKPCSCRHVPFLETEKFVVYRKIVFGIVTGRIEYKVPAPEAFAAERPSFLHHEKRK